jgi:3'(2'), 5'-bisphosphate nucleotidase
MNAIFDQPEGILNQVMDIAEEAGKLILSFYKKNISIAIKSDGSRVTQADKASEKFILNALEKLMPDIPIISEESVESSELSLIEKGNFWLVDPIDGTEGFIRGNGDFAVNIGLLKNFHPYLGVIHAPVSEVTYAGIAKKFSVLKRGDQKTLLFARSPDEEGMIVLLYHTLPPSVERDRFLQKIKIKEKKVDSDALKFGRVAAGEVDIHPFFETCYEWDTAAGHAILQGAGGNITTLDGVELTYGKADFKNPPFLVHGAFSLPETHF